MKFDDLNDNLNEGPISGPAGFAQRAKAKLQKHGTPFMKQQQKRGAAKDAIYKKAKDIKNELKIWMDGNGEKEIGIKDFLDWMKQNTDSYEGTLAAAKQIHTNLFPKADPKPEQGEMDLQQGEGEGKPKTQPKAKTKSNVSPEEAAAGQAKIDADAEEESRQMNPDDTGIEGDGTKQDVTASKGDDEKPKVDTSASIYEARLRAILELDTNQRLASTADGEISNDKLKDNEMDKLIVTGLQQQNKLAGTGKLASNGSAEDSTASAEEPKAKAAQAKAAQGATGKPTQSSSDSEQSGGVDPYVIQDFKKELYSVLGDSGKPLQKQINKLIQKYFE